jgi:hypothetical protein
MISSIPKSTAAQAAAQPAAPTSTQSPAQGKTTYIATPATTPPTSPADTVNISTAAQALLKETLENPSQTAKEASGGDMQAVRLLAREAAAKAAGE